MALERRLVDQFWWQIPQKIENFVLIPNLYISWPIKGHLRLNLGQIAEFWLNWVD